MSESIKLVEVGPRDGLQNEAECLSVEDRVTLIRKLINAGARFLEAGSFVSPKAVPQMADSERVWELLKTETLDLSFLVPNEKGLERALSCDVKSIAVFTATSEAFNQKNIGMSVSESLEVIGKVVKRAVEKNLRVRGYVSTAFGCPYEGQQELSKLVNIVESLIQAGCHEVSVGDTIGVAHPVQVKSAVEILRNHIGLERLAFHFHDTRGMALLNIAEGLNGGIRVFDASIGGLGGCPFAKGAGGNMATEEVVWYLEGLGFKTGISVEKLLEVAAWIEEKIKKPLKGKLYLSRPKRLYYFSNNE